MSETTGAVETQRYSIPGQRLGWRVSQLQQQGYPYQVQALGNGVYVVVVQVPAGAQPFADAAPPRRPVRAMPINVQVAAIIMAVSALAYVAYAVAGGSAILPTGMDAGLRRAVGGFFDIVGWSLVALLAGGALWLARPLLSGAAGLVRGAAGLAGRMRR